MGKISDAFERHQRDREIKVKPIFSDRPQLAVSDEPETPLVKKSLPVHVDPKVVMISAPDSMEAENFRVLRTQLLFTDEEKRPRTIMVSSLLPGEGKTFVSTNLAICFAQGIDEYVLLVDCDLRRPQVHEILGYRNVEGLKEHLIEKRDLKDLIIKTQIDKLSILPAGKRSPNPAELLSSSRMRAFLQEIKERYDDRLVIIDSGPAHITPESKVLGEYVDGIILVVMAGKAPRKEIKKAIDNLGKDKILGIVFNGYNQPTKGYHKYYEEYYGGKR
jgi:exopolysaccharide/PEP-CTERM locus tyrosine autokinase